MTPLNKILFLNRCVWNRIVCPCDIDIDFDFDEGVVGVMDYVINKIWLSSM